MSSSGAAGAEIEFDSDILSSDSSLMAVLDSSQSFLGATKIGEAVS